MIRTKTVLILGAGASCCYGFPTGQELKRIICNNLRALSTPQARLLIQMNYKPEMITDFRNALFYSGKRSVDVFLEKRSEFMNVGRLAIAQSLIPFEDKSTLFVDYTYDTKRKITNWYEYLYNKLNGSPGDLRNNKISIITYNYDRSLEEYLFTTITNTHGIDNDRQVADIIETIPIIHLHGHLGYLPWQDRDGRPYEAKDDVPHIARGSKFIKIISEGDAESDEFKRAREAIAVAEHIYFLGCGYNPTNIQRLRMANKTGQFIGGTSVGLTDRERNDVKGLFQKPIHLDEKGQDVLQFLRNSRLN